MPDLTPSVLPSPLPIPPAGSYTHCANCGKNNGLLNPPAGGRVSVSWVDWCKCLKPDRRITAEDIARVLSDA